MKRIFILVFLLLPFSCDRKGSVNSDEDKQPPAQKTGENVPGVSTLEEEMLRAQSDLQTAKERITQLEKDIAARDDVAVSQMEEIDEAKKELEKIWREMPYTFDLPTGGTGGAGFDDRAVLGEQPTKLTKIFIKTSATVYGIATVLAGPPAVEVYHGGVGPADGQILEYILLDGEYFNVLEVHTGPKDNTGRIFYLRLGTNLNPNVISFGDAAAPTAQSKIYTAPEGNAIVGFIGSSGTELDSLGPIYGLASLAQENSVVE